MAKRLRYRNARAKKVTVESIPAETPGRFNELVASMQTKESRAGVAALFRATPSELGRTAAGAARKPRKRRAG